MATTGYNQTGGAYYMILSGLASNAVYQYSGGSGSGGAYLPGAFTATGATFDATWSNVYEAGKLLKDMGKTVVSAGRTFRKFQPVVAPSSGTGSTSFGVAGYEGYLELGREGSNPNPDTLPRIARFA
jgi:hypothetical protein